MYSPIIWIGFLSNFLLAIILIFVGIWIYSNKAKKPPAFLSPRCVDPICQDLEPKMIQLMKRRLEFKKDLEELEVVQNHLKRMFEEVHNSGDDRTNQHAMFQCLRTTLVEDPEDLRGRRRANEARQIFIYDVLRQRDCFYWMEVGFKRLYEKLTCKSSFVQMILNELSLILGVVQKLIVFVLDVYSDIVIIAAMGAMAFAIDLTESISSERKTSMMESCSIKTNEEFEEKVGFLYKFLQVYFYSLIATFVFSFSKQMVGNRLVALKAENSIGESCLKSLANFCARPLISPIENFWHLYKAQKGLSSSYIEEKTAKNKSWIKNKY